MQLFGPHPEFEICNGAAELALIHPSYTNVTPITTLFPALRDLQDFTCKLCNEPCIPSSTTQLGDSSGPIKSSFSQLPYFCPLFKGLLRAVSGKHVIPVKRDERTPHLYWKKKVHLWNTCIRYSRLALASLGLKLLVHHFKTAGLQTAALGYHLSEQDIWNSSTRHSNRRGFSPPFLYSTVFEISSLTGILPDSLLLKFLPS